MKNILITIAALIAATTSAFAGVGFSQYSTGGAQFNGSAATNYVVITGESSNGGDPVITSISATDDLASGKLQWYTTTNAATCVAVAGFTNTSTIYYVNSTNLWVAGDLMVIEHLFSTNSPERAAFYELGVLSTFGAVVQTNVTISGGSTGTTTNYIYTMTNSFATAVTNSPGDNIYQMTKANVGFFPVYTNIAAANYGINAYSAGGLYSGYRKRPLLGVLNGTSAATINSVSAVFVP